ncbi:endo-1,4-beta-xylanase [Azospirillum sp.]|uniref:endo-1,4-beta-xylanase n=1 Tax=Azospirillum sp. TaxID=34012 RepID=UPI003D71E252
MTAAPRQPRRRDVIAAAAVLPFVPADLCAHAVAAPASLGAVAADKGILFGTACLARHIETDPAYAALLARECRVIVAQDDLKWAALRPAPDRFDFTRADAVAGFCRRIGVPMRGHTLVWHEALPSWCNGRIDVRTAAPLLATHIATVVGRYRSRLHSWDVVNEAVDLDDGRADGLRETPWMRALGPSYVALAFELAAAADPSALLVYNDFGICDASPKARAKRTAVLRLIDRLKAARAPVHALGIQAHLSTSMTFEGRGMTDFLNDVADRGLRVMITELDVADDTPSLGNQDARVADAYAAFLDIVLPHRSTAACITWGLSDRYSWLRFLESTPSHGDLRPLPYDDGYRPKPALNAIQAAFARLP